MKRKLLAVAITTSLAGIAAYGPTARGEEPTGNHLSYPAMLLNGVGSTSFSFSGVGEGTLGANYSYGCAKEEKVTVSGTTYTYPNTSCVSGWKEDGSAVAFLTAEQCTVADSDPTTPHPCQGLPVDRIYWQKIAGNVWTAQSTAMTPPVTVRWVDWGDSIESKTWSATSILRVETQGYADLIQDPRTEIPDTNEPDVDPPGTQVGLQMWHSQGHGINEEWGVRTTETAGGSIGAPYVYASPYAIVNAGPADLYLSKMETGAPPTCPKTYMGPYFTDREWIAGQGWSGACNLPRVDYTVELSVTGKYVHGYNWRVRDLPTALLAGTYCPDMTGSWNKTGWWRLTFVPNGGDTKMQFGNPVTIGPPVTPSSTPAVEVRAAAAGGEEETDGSLYRPVVSPYGTTEGNLNLTWIDLCISSKTGGGGGGGKPGGGTGGGKPPGVGGGKPR